MDLQHSSNVQLTDKQRHSVLTVTAEAVVQQLRISANSLVEWAGNKNVCQRLGCVWCHELYNDMQLPQLIVARSAYAPLYLASIGAPLVLYCLFYFRLQYTH